MDYTSRIYKALDSTEIETVIRAADLPQAESWTYTLLQGGLFNTTYLLKKEDCEPQYVLRVGPINTELLMDFEKTMMTAEPYIYNLLADRGIPVPRVIRMDDSKEVLSRTYILMERVEGIPLNDPSVPKEARAGLLEQLGGYVALMHGIHHEQFGWPTSSGQVRGSRSWADVMKAFIDEMLDRLRQYQLFEEQHINQMELVYASLIPLYKEVKTPCLVHNDLWDPNVMVAKINGDWQITALIDVDRAMFADPEYEYVLWGEEASLIRGYGKKLESTNKAIKRRQSYQLLLCMMNTYVFAVEYDDQESYKQSRTYTLHVLESLRGAMK